MRQDDSKVSENIYLIRAVGKALAHEEDFVKSGGEALLEFELLKVTTKYICHKLVGPVGL